MDRIRLLGWVSVLAVTCALYSPVQSAGWVYEDANWMHQLEVSQVNVLGRIPGRGLTHWTYAAQADGDAMPRPYHLANLALHLLNGVLVWLIARSLVSPLGALVAMAVCLWHPLNTEAVAYISGRSDLLMAFGTLLAVWSALSSSRLLNFFGVLVGCSIAILSKEVGLISVALVLITMRAHWLKYVAVLSLFVGALLVLNVVASLRLDEWLSLMAANAAGAWRIVSLLIVPVGLSLDPDPWAVPVALRWIGVLGMMGVAMWIVRSTGLKHWAAVWIAIVLLPRVLVPSAEPIHDQHAYLALVGFSILVGSFLKGDPYVL